MEILKLKAMLEKANIPFEYKQEVFTDPLATVFGFSGVKHQILYRPKEQNIVCSVIYGNGTYGYEKGLLEIMGLLTDEELTRDTVVGYLSSTEVYRRIVEHYRSVKE